MGSRLAIFLLALSACQSESAVQVTVTASNTVMNVTSLQAVVELGGQTARPLTFTPTPDPAIIYPPSQTQKFTLLFAAGQTGNVTVTVTTNGDSVPGQASGSNSAEIAAGGLATVEVELQAGNLSPSDGGVDSSVAPAPDASQPVDAAQAAADLASCGPCSYPPADDCNSAAQLCTYQWSGQCNSGVCEYARACQDCSSGKCCKISSVSQCSDSCP